MSLALEPANLLESIQVRVRYFMARSPRAGAGKILVVKYDGLCRNGPDGELDGRFMLGMVQAALTIWEPDGFVLDLTDLHCQRRPDGLTSLLCAGEAAFGSENLPQAVVVGPQCEVAIRSFFEGGFEINEPTGCFCDLTSALDYVEEEAVNLYLQFTRRHR